MTRAVIDERGALKIAVARLEREVINLEWRNENLRGNLEIALANEDHLAGKVRALEEQVKWRGTRIDELETKYIDALADERQAMRYLEQIRQAVGPDLGFPGVVKAVKERGPVNPAEEGE